MEAHYFSIETYAKNNLYNHQTDTIISICFQKFNLQTGEKIGKIQILKEWENNNSENTQGELEILKFIHKWFFTRNPWKFIPVGFNLNFEWNILYHKFREYNLDNKELGEYFNNYPQIDLKVLAVLREGTFQGANLKAISNNSKSSQKTLILSQPIQEYYENKEYNEIISIVTNKMNDFLQTYKKSIKIIRNEL